MQHLTIAFIAAGQMYTHTRLYDAGLLSAELSTVFDANYGVGAWLIIPTADLPADFSVDTYTIESGKLVKAPAAVVAERQAARRVAEREAIRAEREARYNSEAISSLYWDWLESGLDTDREAWIAAKNAVRSELPYPAATETKPAR